MKLVRFELRKIFGSKVLIFGIIFLTIVNAYKIYDMYRQSDLANEDFTDFNQYYYSIYNGIKGEITEDNVSIVSSNLQYFSDVVGGRDRYDENRSYTKNPFMDMNLLMRINEDVEYAAGYKAANDALVELANENIRLFESVGNEYDMKLNQSIVKIYNGRVVAEYYDTVYTEMYLRYDFSSLLIILLIIVGLSPLFSAEIETEMNALNSTMYMGGTKTVIAKIAAATVLVLLLSIWFFMEDIICFSSLFPLEGLSLPFYAIKSYRYSIFAGNIALFAILTATARFVAFLIIAFITLIISSLFKEQGIVLCISGIIVAVHILLCGYLPQEFIFLKQINPMNLLTLRSIVNGYSAVNIFGKPIASIIITTVSTIIYLIFLVAIIMLVNRGHRMHRSFRKVRCELK